MTVYSGCVGADEFGRQLEAAARKDGVHTEYLKDPTTPTGTMAVLIHGKERTFVVTLGAVSHFKLAHLESVAMKAALAQARIIYYSAFSITGSLDSMLAAGKYAADTGNTFMTNLAGAPVCCAAVENLLAQVCSC